MRNNHQHPAFPNSGEENQRPHQSRQRERETAEARRRQGQEEAEFSGATAATSAATAPHDRVETTDPGCIAILSAALSQGRSVDPKLTIPQEYGLGQAPFADCGNNPLTIGPTSKDTKGGEARAHVNETSPTSASAAPHMGASRSIETPAGSKAQPRSTTTITSKNGAQSVEGKIELHGTKVKNGSIIDTGEYYMIPKEFCSIIQTGTGTPATNASSGQQFSIDPRWTNSLKNNNGPET